VGVRRRVHSEFTLNGESFVQSKQPFPLNEPSSSPSPVIVPIITSISHFLSPPPILPIYPPRPPLSPPLSLRLKTCPKFSFCAKAQRCCARPPRVARACFFFASWLIFVNWVVFLFHVDLAVYYSKGYVASVNPTVHPK
jgi:hypothetical protein